MRRRNAVSANPLLIGAVTLLVTIVAVYFAYNANNGLPFVPTYDLRAEVPNASGLIRGNEVRTGGARIGVVSRIRARSTPEGPVALLDLKLDKTAEELPADSFVRIRPRSPLGLKYVDLTAGTSTRTLDAGSEVQVRQPPVELDDFFDMFDEPTRRGASGNLIEFGTGFAGRGDALSRAFQGLEPLARRALPALRTINAPATRFAQLFPALEQAASEVAPVAAQNASLFEGLDETLGALAGVDDDIRATIEGGPRSLTIATRELRAQAPAIRETTELFRRLRPGFRELAAGSTDLAAAAADGIDVLPRTPSLNRRLTGTLGDLEDFAADERVRPGIRRLTRTSQLLQPTIEFATPAQTRCNYLGLFFNNLQSALSESDRIGSFLRFSIVNVPQLAGSEAGPTSGPSNGPQASDPRSRQLLDPFLHSNPLPNTAAPGQPAECEAGNEPYITGSTQIGNAPGTQAARTEATGSWRPTP